MSATHVLTDGTTNVNAVLAANAYVIGESIYNKTLNMGRWRAVTPKSALPEGVGDALTSLIYSPSLPTTTAGGSTVGANWVNSYGDALAATSLNTLTEGQVVKDAAGSHVGIADGLSYVTFNKKLLSYGLEITRIRSPWVDINQLRTAAGLAKQVGAIMDALTGVTAWTWERRYQEAYEKVSGNFVSCLAAGHVIRDTVDTTAGGGHTPDDAFTGLKLTEIDLVDSGASGADITPDAYISNAVMDHIYNQLSIMTPPDSAYGMTSGAPVFCLMCSPDASRRLITESGFRDDVREATVVDELIKPLGVNREFRGFFHLTSPEMPRFNITSGFPVRVEPRTATGAYNPLYDTATHEAAYVVHKDVLEAQVPGATVAAGQIAIPAQNYMGDWKWINHPDHTFNITQDKGYFFGQLGSAIKPKHYEYGYVVLYKRDTTTPSA